MSAPRLMFRSDGVGDPHLESDRCLKEPPCRPLVVIDPENREQVRRLTDWMRANGWTGLNDEAPDDMADALRSLVADPKPEEPQGLGAVVEDAEGECWVRSHTNYVNAPWTRPHLSGTYRYGQIAAVRVLSEGVAQ